MAFDISKFLSQTQEGFAREAHFELQLTPPPSINSDSQQIALTCSLANQPGRSVEMESTRIFGHGIPVPIAYGLLYTTLDISFYCDVNGKTLKMLHDWFDLVMPNKTVGSNAMLLNYHDTYSGTGILTQYAPDGSTIMTTKFIDIFPSSLGPINFSWAAQDSLVLIPATFTYTYYTVDNQTNTQGTRNVSTTQQPSQVTNLPSTGNTTV